MIMHDFAVARRNFGSKNGPKTVDIRTSCTFCINMGKAPMKDDCQIIISTYERQESTKRDM